LTVLTSLVPSCDLADQRRQATASNSLTSYYITDQRRQATASNSLTSCYITDQRRQDIALMFIYVYLTWIPTLNVGLYTWL